MESTSVLITQAIAILLVVFVLAGFSGAVVWFVVGHYAKTAKALIAENRALQGRLWVSQVVKEAPHAAPAVSQVASAGLSMDEVLESLPPTPAPPYLDVDKLVAT